jgi:cysteine desulfurase
MTLVYLDNNATTRVAPEVVEAMMPYLTDRYGNPSSMHRAGARAAGGLKEAREKAAAFLHCRESEIVFTSGGTESNNLAIRGVVETFRDKRHIVTTRVEHPSVLEVCKQLEHEGYPVTYLSVDREGMLDLAGLEQAITDQTALVSIMWANNETGVIFPIGEIAEITRRRGVLLHVDGVQAAAQLPIDVEKTPIDLLTLSGHKLHAPKGVGLLFIRREARIRPFIIGGGQERGRRSGTENLPGIVGLGKAIELANERMTASPENVRRLRDKLEAALLSTIPDSSRNGANEPRLPNTSHVRFEGVEGEAVLILLDEAGICASGGSACSTGALEPSHVLKAMGISGEAALGAVRFSLSLYTTEEEIDRVIEVLPGIVQRLRNVAAAGRGSKSREA